MPSRPKSRKRYHKKKSKLRASAPVTASEAALSAEQPASKETFKPQRSSASSGTSSAGYAYVVRDLRRIAVVTGIVLVILILLYIFLR